MRRIGLAVSFGLAPFLTRAQLLRRGAYQRYSRRIRAGFCRLVALAVIISMTLTGCAGTPYYYIVPDLRDRAKQIASIAAVPVDVRLFRAGLGGHELSDEWSEVARVNLRNAMAKYFGSDPRFAAKEFDPKGTEAIQLESERVRNVMEDIRLHPKGRTCMPGPTCACLSGPAIALADGAGTDFLLLAYGRDRITTAGLRAAIVIGFVLALPLIVLLLLITHAPVGIVGATDPPMSTLVQNPQTSGATADLRLPSLNAITLCLVDARQGDTLWFDFEPIGTGDLRDASDVDRLIGNAYGKFRKAMGPIE